MYGIKELKEIVHKIKQLNDVNPINHVVTNTISRSFDREANFAFSIMGSMYNTNNLETINVEKKTKSKVLLIKPVGDHCNLKCTYCYEIQRLNNNHQKVMDITQLNLFIKNLVSGDSDISDIFIHGGEPLLAGISFFEEFIKTLKKFNLYGKVVLGVQTNGTLLNQEWVDFFIKHNFSIGISLDGDKEINDSFRIDHKERGSYDLVLKGIKLLQKNNVKFGIISVVTSENSKIPDVANRILKHHIDIGIDFLDIHPAFTPKDTSGTSAECNLSRSDYTSFMTDLALAWSNSNNPNLHLRCFEDIIQNLTESKSASCYASGSCTSIIGLDPSGNLSPCTRPFHDKYVFGNASKLNLSEIEKQESYNDFSKNESLGQKQTINCEWSSLCGYGNCPHERFKNGKQDPSGKHIFCSCHDDLNSNNGFPGFYKNFNLILDAFYNKMLQIN